MRFKDVRESKATKIEIIPMIDTMFFLLVFFILAALNIIDLRGIYLELPSTPIGKPVPQVDKKQIEVTIDKDGNMTVGGDVGNPLRKGDGIGAAMKKAIEEQSGTPEATTLIIAPDGATPHEFLIKCIDEARGIKIEKFSIR